ncbi:arginase [Ignavibacteria bacterium CHB1]|nr:MAG: arginase [Chlorobiota bacterium]MBW7856285.1 arginase [Ignavibacteria bacterium]MCE7952092.1 arginase [Chlorobi bacterium CHB7]MDL1886351.1 arginase [Ignavibacteria bacterium CHB1]OQY78884.1 MAG: arginase [Ignavibacteriales bacterium UTCHB1]RIK48892.1 MAG: arginase [Ignavibacteriota bacterium]
MNKKVGIIGFPMDLGADRRGVDMGPSAIRYANLKKKLEALGYVVDDFGDIAVNILETQKIKNIKLKYLPEIERASKLLSEKVTSILDRKYFPLVLGGDHATAIGSIAGISSYCKKNNKTLGVVWIDAHADMNTEETTPSGNIHGMPLAIAMGLGYKSLIKINGFSPKVDIENIAMIGIRDVDKLEAETIKKLNPIIYTMTDIDKIGIHRVISKVLGDFKKRVDFIHISFDLDGIDPEYAPGVGTPVHGGLTFREAHLIMEMIAECGCMSSLEMVEVNPILDIKNETAELTTELILSALGKNTLHR